MIVGLIALVGVPMLGGKAAALQGPLRAVKPLSPDQVAREWAAFLKAHPDARCRIALWMNAVPDGKDAELWAKVQAFWLNQMSREPDVTLPRPVPSVPGLWWGYLDDWGWTHEAWQEVAEREPYFREPFVGREPAAYVRAAGGWQAKGQFPHVVGVVRGDWFFRETVETDRSESYYDLLYARERFGEGGKAESYEEDERFYWQGGVDKDGDHFPAGWYTRKVKKQRRAGGKGGDRNFPKNLADFDKAFGIDVIEKLIKDQKLQVTKGSVVDEGLSIVSRHNRLLRRLPALTGYAWRSFDVKETSGKRDFGETFFFGFEHDAGEMIYSLPNGGQAYFLTVGGKEEKRAEVGDNKVVNDTSDITVEQGRIKIGDARVRNPGSCVVCHPRGINEPANLVADWQKAGIVTKFADLQKEKEFRAFFKGVNDKVKVDQLQYEAHVKETSGLTPEQNSAEFKRFRAWYDEPLSVEQMARECGATVDELKFATHFSPRHRLQAATQGLGMPRGTWEKDGYRETMLLIVAGKKQP